MERVAYFVLLLAVLAVAIWVAKKPKKQDEEMKTLEKRLGKCSQSVCKYDFSLYAFDTSRKMVINGNEYDYSDVIDCDINVISREYVEEMPAGKELTATLKTSGKSMVGRSIAGAVVAGKVGAVIGGATAKKNITIESREIPASRKTTSRTLYEVTIRTASSEISMSTGDEDAAKSIKSAIDRIK